ncbi:hypothetical protein EC973_000655 [Apophysomyces ossiformis]|uniref:chitin synthase n=1 Tax=Apophysomyces ossiformis TaxID=679940 RepID=A0A8H7ESE6_9FUNG|nr:hypothetical protein EC973_000655 [Apophysomyces ossiformis]
MTAVDLTQLTNNNEICELLRNRFADDKPYTRLGHHRIVVVNPYKSLDIWDDSTLQAYANHGYKDLLASADGFDPEPHIYELVTRVYFIMRRRAEDQAIVLSGHSGSGKSTTHRHLLDELLLLSTHTRREEKLQRQIISANTILEVFGVAATPDNPTASRLGKYQVLQFNERGHIVGTYVSIYLLDKFRTTFDIFYQLLAGTTADEKNALHINHSADYFAYLKQAQHQQNIRFDEIKTSLKSCGFKAKTIAQIFQLLAAILHLGNIQFIGGTSVTAQESCQVKNKETLSLVAAALGVATSKLESTLTHKLKLIGKEFCTAFLTVETAVEQRDALARALYTILVLWIVDTINAKLSATNLSNTITILDPVGLQTSAAGFHDLCLHYAAERIHQHVFRRTLDPALNAERPTMPASIPSFSIPSIALLLGTNGNKYALTPLMNRESQRFQAYALDATDTHLLSTMFQRKKANDNDYRALQSPSTPSQSFAIQHFNTLVDYSVEGFLEHNVDALSPDFIHLFRYNCTNSFVHDLFESPVLMTEMHPRDERTIIKAQLPCFPMQWKRQGAQSEDTPKIASVLDQVSNGLDSLEEALTNNRIFEILHIRPNYQQTPGVFDPSVVQQQLEAFRVIDYAHHCTYYDAMYSYTFDDFATRYRHLLHSLSIDPQGSAQSQIEQLVEMMQWTDTDAQLDQDRIWLSFPMWRDIENHLRVKEKEARFREKQRLAAIEAEKEASRLAAAAAAAEAAEIEAAEAAEAEAAALAAESAANNAEGLLWDNPFDDECRSDLYSMNDYGDNRTELDDYDGNKSQCHWGEDEDDMKTWEKFGPNMDMSKMVEDYRVQSEEQVEEVPITPIRQSWGRFVWLATWWIPSFTLRWFGKMTRQDVQMAWREKLTLCMMIFLFSASIIFFIVGLGEVICPGTKDLYSSEDVKNHQTIADYWVSVRGKVYDMTKFVTTDHGTATFMASQSTMEPLAGRDLSYTFPPPLTVACAGLVFDDSVTVTPNETIVLGPYVHFSGGQQPAKGPQKLRDPNWITKSFEPRMNAFKKGDLVIPMKQIKDDYHGWGRLIATIDEKVYDLTDYMNTAHQYPIDSEGVPNYHYLSPEVEKLFTKYGGKDATQEWHHNLRMDAETRARNQQCLDNVFYIGRLDYRESVRCTFVNYLLLSFAVIMSLVILVKFLAALQFGGAPTPEEHDKFVICQVPCYTEDEESLRKTIDSLTAMSYDDRRKLLFLIADGMIIGSGNDKPTPRILLDILGHDQNDDPEPLMFKSIGEGSKQLNYGKVYSGLYQHEGHTVPYVVVVKVGKSTEHTKPGNRGKRDSQIICMNFLSKVHFNSEMTPLELEIYYNIKHVIGVDPSFYEYILMVDSDTEVYPDALNRLISCMLHDSRIIGLCGETELGNEDRSWATMIQVYEYYISHHLVKAFESLFGSVTCLPGCFCMYRIRTANKRQPLIVSPNVIHGYSDNQVDTLHKKNLLHLGEDRYLTTLMMKNFPQYKMMFTPYAKCRTVAPDEWRVLLSQRRRWINSTIHNLLELILLPELCGFCCFSMRFVVMIDLIGTITLPSSVIYLVYLVYSAMSGGPIPMIALGMLAGAYGLQALIFIVKRQWQHIGWMVIYIFAIPIFSFFIPLYAFWHFDDFSWGNTRVVVGDKKKQIIVTDDEKFDDKMIPLKKWAQYEQELWETKSTVSEESKASGYSYVSQSTMHKSRYSHISRSSSSPTNQQPSTLLPSLVPTLPERRLSQFSVDMSAILHPGKTKETTVLPEDEDIEREIYQILSNANLMTLTKKQVRDQLSNIFGVDLTIKKGFINSTIERILE